MVPDDDELLAACVKWLADRRWTTYKTFDGDIWAAPGPMDWKMALPRCARLPGMHLYMCIQRYVAESTKAEIMETARLVSARR